MENMDQILVKRFSLDGVILDDSMIWQRKKDYMELLGIQMRNTGYVPILDIPVEFELQYNSRNSSYSFVLAVFGMYVGERESEWIYGVDAEGPIPIPQSRSKESFSEVA